MKKMFLLSFISICFAKSLIYGEEAFKVVVLGSGGGPKESNISGYLVAPIDSTEFVAIDGGSLLGGIYLASQNGCFDEIEEDPESIFQKEVEIYRHNIKGYLISHAHLDHVAGLIINSTEDVSKPIYAIDSVIDFLRDHLFNGKIWPNFGSEGNAPILNLYPYQRLQPEKAIHISGTKMNMEPFLLSHSRCYESSAFLIESAGSYVMYFGDTAPDILESEKLMENAWRRMAPLVLDGRLKGIFLECSFRDRPDHLLFGHLDAKNMMQELRHFARLVNPLSPEEAIKGLKVLVTHMKDPLLKKGAFIEDIARELEMLNDLGVVFIFPCQGQKILL
jgi:3',5'-cyclic-nucleotide phosphodiesterase